MQVSTSPVPEMSGDVSWALEGPSPPYINGWERFVSPFSAIIPTPLFCKLPECYLPPAGFHSSFSAGLNRLEQKQFSPTHFPQNREKDTKKGQQKSKRGLTPTKPHPAPVSTAGPPLLLPRPGSSTEQAQRRFCLSRKAPSPSDPSQFFPS